VLIWWFVPFRNRVTLHTRCLHLINVSKMEWFWSITLPNRNEYFLTPFSSTCCLLDPILWGDTSPLFKVQCKLSNEFFWFMSVKYKWYDTKIGFLFHTKKLHTKLVHNEVLFCMCGLFRNSVNNSDCKKRRMIRSVNNELEGNVLG
jgi:hypothetical protein